MTTLSIAMATYNGEQFILEQLKSFQFQTTLPNELVVTDDGSTDRTLEIIKEFAATAPFPVRVVSNTERMGYRGNFMKAAGLCTSELVAFSDQDDLWAPEKIAKCIELLKNPDVLLVHHNAMVVTGTLEPIALMETNTNLPTLNAPHSIEPWKFGLGFALVFRRKLLAFNSLWPKSSDFYFFNTLEGHDQWFFFLAACLGTIGYINEPLVLYRQHGKNTMGWNTAQPDGNLKNNFKNLTGTSLDGLKTRELAAGARAFVLEQILDSLNEPLRERAKIAAVGYRKLELRYRTREQIYSSGRLTDRLQKLAALVSQGGYKKRYKWGVGPKAFVRDVVYGFILPAKK